MPSEATSSNNSPLAAVATEGLPITPFAETGRELGNAVGKEDGGKDGSKDGAQVNC